MRALGLPNTKHFHEITKIEDALAREHPRLDHYLTSLTHPDQLRKNSKGKVERRSARTKQ